jgi:hypothetical protein
LKIQKETDADEIKAKGQVEVLSGDSCLFSLMVNNGKSLEHYC